MKNAEKHSSSNNNSNSTPLRNHKVNGNPIYQRNRSKGQSQSYHPSITRPSPPDIKLRDPILSEMWLKIDELTHKQGSAYGVVKKVISENTTKFPWLTRDLLNNYRKKATKQMQLPPLDVNLQKQGTLVSDLTSEVIIEHTSSLEGSQSLPEGRPSHLLVGSSSTDSSNDSPEIVPARNIGGRPKGATNAAKESRIKRKLEALNEAAVQFMQAKQIDQARKHGTLKKIVDDVNMKYNLDGDDEVKTETVRTRCKKGRKLLVASCGPIPCVLELEPFFVETFMKLAAMRQPVTPTEALQFINSTIKSV